LALDHAEGGEKGSIQYVLCKGSSVIPHSLYDMFRGENLSATAETRGERQFITASFLEEISSLTGVVMLFALVKEERELLINSFRKKAFLLFSNGRGRRSFLGYSLVLNVWWKIRKDELGGDKGY